MNSRGDDMNLKINKLFVFIGLLLIPIMLAGCSGGGGGGSAWFDTTVILKSVEVEPAQSSIALGKNVQLTATGIYSDGTRKDLTSVVAWSSSTEAVATVSASGLATSHSAGQTTIKAVFENLLGSSTLTVTERVLESIDITPVLPSIALGTVTAVYGYWHLLGRYHRRHHCSSRLDFIGHRYRHGKRQYGHIRCGRFNHDHRYTRQRFRQHRSYGSQPRFNLYRTG